MPTLSSDNNLNIHVKSTADTTGVTKTEESVGKLKDTTDKAHTSLENFTKSFVFGNAIYSLAADAAIRVKDTFGDVVKSAQDWQAQQAALNAALTSTKDVSGLSASEVKNYAEELSKTSPISREAALAGENMLLTFTNIHKDTFPQTTQAVADLATAMNHNLTPNAEMLSAAAIKIGKAMNDPEKGLTALGKAGVKFTDQQKDQIKTMQDAGNITGAQTIILKELSTEFGGRAAAAADTFSGKIQMMHNKVNDLTGDGIIKLNARLNDLTHWWNVHQEAVKKVVDQVVNFLEPSFKALWNTLEQKVIPTLDKLWHQVIEPLLPIIGGTFVLAIKLALDAFNLLLAAITPVINFMLNHKQIVLDLAAAFGVLAAKMAFDAIFNALAIGFNELILIRIPSLMASITSLRTTIGASTTMGAIGIAGAIADIALVMQAVQSVLGAINAMNQAKKSAQDASTSYAAVVHRMQGIAAADRAAGNQAGANAIAKQIAGLTPYAAGTDYAIGGMSLVGEQGPEIVNLPRGSQVIPANQTKQMLSHSNTHIYGDIYLSSPAAVTEFFNKIDRDNLLVSKGLSPARGAS